MLVIARIADIEISDADIALEDGELRANPESLKQDRSHILSRWSDSCLLYQEAVSQGIEADEDEYDMAKLQSLEALDDSSQRAPVSAEEARELERKITREIVVRKYIRSLCGGAMDIPDAQLEAFYEDQKEIFNTPEQVRASHILISKHSPDAELKAQNIRLNIHSREDFAKACSECSDCPSNMRCGDLGFFRRGQMIEAIEKVAFSMQVGQISPVFSSSYGYHILMLTGHKDTATVPLNDIRDSLRARLVALEREFFLIKHLKDLREKYRSLIQILDASYYEAL